MTVRVALVQASPRPFDVTESIDRACARVRDAAAQGAELIALGETWLCGYPAWIDFWPRLGRWDDARVKELHALMREHAIEVPGPHVDRLSALARELGVVLVVGLTERVSRGPGHGTLYNSIVVLDEVGRIAVHHRKLVPTHGERLLYGPGDAAGLRVAQTRVGPVGALVCWEHWMPLARHALHSEGERIHVALWPTVHEVHQIASRHYAFEGRCFVLAVGQMLHVGELPGTLAAELEGAPADGMLLRGGSCVIGPDGRFVVPPRFDDPETVFADLDLGAIDREVGTLDVSGHFARPELFEVRIDRRRFAGGSEE
jgi:predicted amidohydrolase